MKPLRSRIDYLFLAIGCLAASCGEMSNLGTRSRSIHDLDRFKISSRGPLSDRLDYFLVDKSDPREIDEADGVFFREGTLWVYALRPEEGGLQISEVGRSGQANRTVALSLEVLPRSIVADDLGSILMLIEDEVVELDLQARKIVTDMYPIKAEDASKIATVGRDLYFLREDGVAKFDPSTGVLEPVLASLASTQNKDLAKSAGQGSRDGLLGVVGRPIHGSGPVPDSWIAVNDSAVIVERNRQSSDAIMLDPKDGRILGFLGGVPSGAAVGLGTRWFGVEGRTELVEFEVGTKVESAEVGPPVQLANGGAVALAAVGQNLWVLFADEQGGQKVLELIEYDPTWLEPRSGYQLEPAVGEFLRDVEYYSMFYSERGLVIIASSNDESRFIVIEHESGEVSSQKRLDHISWADSCYDGEWVWTFAFDGDAVAGEEGPFLYRESLANFLEDADVGEGTLTPLGSSRGYPSVVCLPRGEDYHLLLSTSESRHWRGWDPESRTERDWAFPLTPQGAGGAVVDGRLWILDRGRGRVFGARIFDRANEQMLHAAYDDFPQTESVIQD